MATTATAHLQRYSGAPVGSCCIRTAAPAFSIRPSTLLRNFCYGQPIGPRHGVGNVLPGVTRSYASDLADLLHLSVVQVDTQAVLGLLGLLVVAAATPLLYAQAQQANSNQLGLASGGAPWAHADADAAATPPPPPAAARPAASVAAGGDTDAGNTPAASGEGAVSAPAFPSVTPAAAAAAAAAAPDQGAPSPTPSSHPAAPSTSPASTPTAAAPPAGAAWEAKAPSQRLLPAPTSSSEAQRLLPDQAGSHPRRAAPSLLAPPAAPSLLAPPAKRSLLASPAKRLGLPAHATNTGGSGSGSSHGTTGSSTGGAQPPAAAVAVAPQAAPLDASAAARQAPPAVGGPSGLQQQQDEEGEGEVRELDSLALAAALLAASDTTSSSRRDASPPPSVITSLDEAADALLLPSEAQVGPGELSLAVGLLRAAGQDEEDGIGPATGHTLTQRLHQLLVLLDARPGAGREALTSSRGGDAGQPSSNSNISSVMDSFWGEEDDWEDVRSALMAVGLDQSLDEEQDLGQGGSGSGAGAAAFLDAGSVQRLGELLQELRARQGLPPVAAPAGGSGPSAAAGEGVEEVGGGLVEESSEEAAWWEAVGTAYQAVWEEARLVKQQAA